VHDAGATVETSRNQATSFHLIVTIQPGALPHRGIRISFATPQLPPTKPRACTSHGHAPENRPAPSSRSSGRSPVSADEFGPVQAFAILHLARDALYRAGRTRTDPPPEAVTASKLLGAPAESAFAPRLLDADFHHIGHETPPLPIPSTVSALASGAHDAELVRCTARLLAHERRALDDWFVESFVLEASDTVFEASCAHAPPTRCRHYRQIRASSSTASAPSNPARQICVATFKILLRGPEDVRYLGQAPFLAAGPARRGCWGWACSLLSARPCDLAAAASGA